MKTYFSIADFNVSGKTVLVRTGFDVPIENGKIKDITRIRANLPTIEYLLKENAKVILISHLGRPKGKFDSAFSLKPAYDELKKIMKKEEGIYFLPDCKGAKVFIERIKPGELVLLENLRFYNEEEENSRAFAQELASYADYYVDDAFGAAHRAHASIDAITSYIPSAIGLLMEQEIRELSNSSWPLNSWFKICDLISSNF